jgi:pectate lyase
MKPWSDTMRTLFLVSSILFSSLPVCQVGCSGTDGGDLDAADGRDDHGGDPGRDADGADAGDDPAGNDAPDMGETDGTPIGILADPDYREGFGKNADGGASGPTYVVTSSAERGPGTLYEAFQPGDFTSDMTIVFEVDTVTLYDRVFIGSNVTIDGMANGMNGVTLDIPATERRGLIVEDPASNIVIRGLNFRSTGTPDSEVTEFDLLALDGTNGSGSPISNVFIDRCTFVQGSDGALDITGNVSNITVQRCLFYNNAKTMLIKYDSRSNFSIHHNVFTHNGERNPQVKGDMNLIDFVNNILYLNDVPAYPDHEPTDPYGVRIWSGSSESDSPGNVVGNFTAGAYIGSGTEFVLEVEDGASLDGVYIDTGGSTCSPVSNCADSPRTTPNDIPADFAMTTLPVARLETELLPVVGAPNRTELDQQRIDDVASALP